MITQEQLIQWLKNPEYLSDASTGEIRDLMTLFPYFESIKWLYLKKLYIDSDVRFDIELMNNAMYFSNRKFLYHFIYNKQGTFENIEEVESTPDLNQIPTASGDYFALTNNKKGVSSLRELAEKIKRARLAKKSNQAETATATKEPAKPEIKAPEQAEPEVPKKNTNIHYMDITEKNAIACIRAKKYEEALEILEALNLTKSKKSSYFADQILFLKTILKNK